jgi:hypothetical protein
VSDKEEFWRDAANGPPVKAFFAAIVESMRRDGLDLEAVFDWQRAEERFDVLTMDWYLSQLGDA